MHGRLVHGVYKHTMSYIIYTQDAWPVCIHHVPITNIIALKCDVAMFIAALFRHKMWLCIPRDLPVAVVYVCSLMHACMVTDIIYFY